MAKPATNLAITGSETVLLVVPDIRRFVVIDIYES